MKVYATSISILGKLMKVDGEDVVGNLTKFGLRKLFSQLLAALGCLTK
jgi:hypothetical protein